MIEVKQSVARRLAVRLVDVAGDGVSGINYNDVTVYVKRQDEDSTLKTLTADGTDWFIDTNIVGEYDILMSTTDLALPGSFRYQVAAPDAKNFVGHVNVVANLESDTKADTAAIKLKTDNLPSDPADASVIVAAFAVTDGMITAVDGVVDAIKLQTDLIPADPADASVVAAAFAATDALVTTVDSVVDAIKLKTDLIPAVPASAGDVTTVGAAVAAMAVTVAEVDTAVDAIQAKTDALPTDPADASVIAAAFAATDVLISTVDAVADAIKLRTDLIPNDPVSAGDLTTATTSITAAVTAVGDDIADLGGNIEVLLENTSRLLGLHDENTVKDQIVYSGNDVTSARVRHFQTKAGAEGEDEDELLVIWRVAYTYTAPGRLSRAVFTLE